MRGTGTILRKRILTSKQGNLLHKRSVRLFNFRKSIKHCEKASMGAVKCAEIFDQPRKWDSNVIEFVNWYLCSHLANCHYRTEICE
jgi:hypothetical protein